MLSPCHRSSCNAAQYLLRNQARKYQRMFRCLLLASLWSLGVSSYQQWSSRNKPEEEIRKAELVPGSSGLPTDTSERIMNIVSFNRTPSLEPFVWEKIPWKKIVERTAHNAKITITSTGLQKTYTVDNDGMLVGTEFPEWGTLDIKIGALKITIDITVRPNENPETYFERILVWLRQLPAPVFVEVIDALLAFYPYVSDSERHGTLATNLNNSIYWAHASVKRAQQSWSTILYGDCDDKAQMACYYFQKRFPSWKAYIIYLREKKGIMHHVAVLFQESENEPIYWTDGSHSDCAPLENIMGLLERKGYVPAHEEILPSGHVLHYAGDNITRQQEPLKELFIWWKSTKNIQ